MSSLSPRQLEALVAALQALQPSPPGEREQPRRSGLARVSEAAVFLSVSRPYLYKLISQGEIPVKRIGSAVRIPWTWLEEQVATNPAD